MVLALLALAAAWIGLAAVLAVAADSAISGDKPLTETGLGPAVRRLHFERRPSNSPYHLHSNLAPLQR